MKFNSTNAYIYDMQIMLLQMWSHAMVFRLCQCQPTGQSQFVMEADALHGGVSKCIVEWKV